MKDLSIKFKKQLKSFIPTRKVNPIIYWMNLLYIFFIITVALIIFSFYLLYQIKNNQTFQVVSSNTKSPTIIDDKLFNSVQDYFLIKKIREGEIKNGLKTYKDPSI